DDRQYPGRDHEHQAVGNWYQAAFDQDVGFAVGIVGANELAGNSQFAAQVCRPGLLRQEGIWTGLDEAAVGLFGAQRTAKPGGALKKNVLQRSALPTLLLQVEGGAKPGNASADDGNASHFNVILSERDRAQRERVLTK